MFAVFRSLHMKLMLILLLLITSLMAVVGAFLTTSVSSFYIDTFYEQISAVFSDDSDGYVSTLRARAAEPDGAAGIKEMLRAGPAPGHRLRSPSTSSWMGRAAPTWTGLQRRQSSPGSRPANLLTARNAVAQGDSTLVGDRSDITADYMDAAIPIMGGGNAYIIYILDNKDTVTDLNSQLFLIIMQALVIGLLISVLLSLLLSKTMVGPIMKSSPPGAERVAAGDFDSQLPVESTDEIGILTGTFNEMADVLQATLAAVENERNKLDTLFLHMTDGRGGL